jgi:DNA-binding response OmpR family regulator
VGEGITGSAASAARFQSPFALWLPDFHGRPGKTATRRPLNFARDHGHEGQQSIHVLLIEDDPAIAEMYRVQLEYDGYRVTIAATGEFGYTTMVTSRPDLVLLDLLLPDRSGLEIMADLNEGFPNHPPVVILSNYGEPTMIDRGISLGALEYLVKSRVTPASVSQSIRGWIEQARQGRSEPHS